MDIKYKGNEILDYDYDGIDLMARAAIWSSEIVVGPKLTKVTLHADMEFAVKMTGIADQIKNYMQYKYKNPVEITNENNNAL